MFCLFAMLVDNTCKKVTQFRLTFFNTLPVAAAETALIRRCRWSRSNTFCEDTEVFR
jgi:hypothetical protein